MLNEQKDPTQIYALLVTSVEENSRSFAQLYCKLAEICLLRALSVQIDDRPQILEEGIKWTTKSLKYDKNAEILVIKQTIKYFYYLIFFSKMSFTWSSNCMFRWC